MSGWTRPERVTCPKVWLRDKGFVVRDVTPDIEPYVIQLMVIYIEVDKICT